MTRPVKMNADFFAHNNGMRNDIKLKAVRRKLGVAGYGVYNMLLEVLTEAEKIQIVNNPMQMELLAADFEIEISELTEYLEYFTHLDLIQDTGEYIRCRQLDNRLRKVFDKRTVDLNDLRGVSDAETPQETHIEKKRKVKNSKAKDFIAPSFDELLPYFKERAIAEYEYVQNVEHQAKLYYSIRSEKDWIKANGEKVKSWKGDVRTWVLTKQKELHNPATQTAQKPPHYIVKSVKPCACGGEVTIKTDANGQAPPTRECSNPKCKEKL